jgi:hypothetical protein
MPPKTPKVKHRARVVLSDSNGRTYRSQWQKDDIHESADLHTWGAYLRVPVGNKIGKVETFIVTVEYLGEKQYKQTYQQRVKALASSEKRREKWQKERERLELEKNEKELIQRRNRIMNQIELAFVKKGKDAVNFVTCDKCDAMAKFLGLAFENSGSTVIDPDQITGAWCQDHNSQHQRPFKTKAAIPCELLEFFYDGLRQLYVKKPDELTGATTT